MVRLVSWGPPVLTETEGRPDDGQGSSRSQRKRSSAGASQLGRRRLEKMAGQVNSTAGSAYQGAAESVLAIVIAMGIGYWVDGRWDTSPWGLLVGAVTGFAAFVLRLSRMRKLVQNQGDGVSPDEPKQPRETRGSGPSGPSAE